MQEGEPAVPLQHSIPCSPQPPTELPEQNLLVPLGLPGFQILSQRLTAEGAVEVTIISTTDRAVCPHCGRVSPKPHDQRLRRKRDVPLAGRQVSLLLVKRRFWCLTCRRSFTESDTICGWRRRTTERLRQSIGTQACSRPITHVATEFEVGPRLVQQCLERVVRARLSRHGCPIDAHVLLPTPRFLGIDDFARRKGQRYATILCDLQARRVLDIVVGRTQAEVCPLLERLADPERVEAVSMDMSGSFREAVHLCLPRARIVADHFHVVQHVGKALAQVLSRCVRSQEGRTALKGQRHLFLRAAEDLAPEEEERRTQLAQRFPDLAAAWQQKETLRHWYDNASLAAASAGLDAWIAAVEGDGPPELVQALSAFRSWREEILNFFVFLPTRISNGFVEGKNNRTKALMRQAYGFRNFQHLRLRVLLEVAL
jgi:transposase